MYLLRTVFLHKDYTTAQPIWAKLDEIPTLEASVVPIRDAVPGCIIGLDPVRASPAITYTAARHLSLYSEEERFTLLSTALEWLREARALDKGPERDQREQAAILARHSFRTAPLFTASDRRALILSLLEKGLSDASPFVPSLPDGLTVRRTPRASSPECTGQGWRKVKGYASLGRVLALDQKLQFSTIIIGGVRKWIV